MASTADLKENEMTVISNPAQLRCLDSAGNSGIASLELITKMKSESISVSSTESPIELDVVSGSIIKIRYNYDGTTGLFYKDTNNSLYTIRNALPSNIEVVSNGDKISISSKSGRYNLYVGFISI